MARVSTPEQKALDGPLIDTHCHLAFDSFDPDRADVVQRAREAGVVGCVVVAVDAESALAARSLADALPGWAYATAGIHPTEDRVGDLGEFDEVTALIASGRFVAVGETGLDGHHDCAPLEVQQAAFERHLQLALEHDLPAVIHCRDAFEPLHAALRPYRGAGLRGVLHCFTGGPSDVEALVGVGLHIGVGGVATFKANAALRDTVRDVPEDRLLVETDAPWLAPTPRRGRRNEPAYVAHTAACLADDRDMPHERFAALTTANAQRLFSLPPA